MIGKLRYLLFLSVSCAILSEWKLSPFEDQFRFSFGAAVFFFFLLWNRSVHPVLAGAAVGGVIVLFRTAINLMVGNFHGHLLELILQNVPPFFYYFSFSVFFYLFRFQRFVERPVLLGMLGTLVDVLSNSCELLARFLMYHSVFTISKFNMII
jgi:two-component system sensor histidine kinase YcbA